MQKVEFKYIPELVVISLTHLLLQTKKSMDGHALQALIDYKQTLLAKELYEELHELQQIEKAVDYDIPIEI